jgi:hypothetical protein
MSRCIVNVSRAAAAVVTQQLLNNCSSAGWFRDEPAQHVARSVSEARSWRIRRAVNVAESAATV